MAKARTANIVSFEEARRARRRVEAVGAERREQRDQREEAATRERGRRETRRRERTRARAERMYSRQFAGSDAGAGGSANAGSSAGREDGAPRPALYETKMGSAHRRSARMQRSSTAGPASARVNPAGWPSSLNLSERVLKAATVVTCVLLTCVFLYVPAQRYYQAQREHDRLAVEFSEIEKRNDALDVQNDILASDAGMEDAVRQKYGYVKAGEQTAVVTGLSDSATDTSRGSENIEANVLSSNVKSPEEWYTPLLDAFFGVE